MKRIILAVFILLLLITQCFADQLEIPKSCYPKQLQEQFLLKGLILDLPGEERTSISWALLENKGGMFVIYTYRSVTEKELQLVMEIINE